ncbi:MAG: leucine-rich repeat protein [Bacilli bacterium]|nr:leucine-rich repeat protein [Bacilli bacterium]
MPNAAEKARLAREALEAQKRQEKAEKLAAKEARRNIKTRSQKSPSVAAPRRTRARTRASRVRARLDQPYLLAYSVLATISFFSALLLCIALGIKNVAFLRFTNVFFWISVFFTVGSLLLIPLARKAAEREERTRLSLTALCIALAVINVAAVTSYHLTGKRFYRGETVSLGVRYLLEDNKARVIGYEGTEENVVLAETIEGKPVDEISEGAFKDNDVIHTIVINSHMDIMRDAFASCRNLTSIEFGDHNVTVHDHAFLDAFSLSYVHLGKGKLTYSYGAGKVYDRPFQGCAAGLTLDIDGGRGEFPVMYDGYLLNDFSTIKLGASSVLNTVELCNANNLVLKDSFRFATSSIRLETGLFIKQIRPIAPKVYIHKSIDSIGPNLFGDVSSDRFSTITCYYEGSQSEWEALSISNEGNGLYREGKVEMHFSSSFVD